MVPILAALLGLAVGVLIGWAAAQRRARAADGALVEARQALSAAEARAAAAEARIEERDAAIAAQQRNAEELQRQLRESFAALAGEALKQNSASFQQQTELQLQPLKEQLGKLEAETKLLENKRSGALGALQNELQSLHGATQKVLERSLSLETALRGSSSARGQWGEQVLDRIFELAGMREGTHYTRQTTLGSGLRPDFLVLLPEGDVIPVDSKAPWTAFQLAQAEPDADRRAAHLRQHAADLRGHVRALARKDYAADVTGRVDFTVLFLPGDHLLDAAVREHPALLEEAMQQRVVLATQTSLMALLRMVAFFWRQHATSVQAEQIRETAEEFYERVRKFAEHFGKVGSRLKGAVGAYDDAVGSFNRQVLPQGRRIEELQSVEPARRLAEGERIGVTPREDLTLPDSEKEIGA